MQVWKPLTCLLTNPAVQPVRNKSAKAIKSATFRYNASEDLSQIFEDFRMMCNDAIRIAINEKPKNKLHLIELSYPHLKAYGLHTHYVLSACEVAYAVYKSRRDGSVPFVKKAFLKLDNQTYRLNHMLLRIPTKPHQYTFLTLQGSDYHLRLIDDPDLKKGSLTITSRAVIIALTKEVEPFEPIGYIGIDLNEKNVTVSATDGYCHQFDELSQVVEIKERYRELRRKVSRVTRNDNRVSKDLLAKYGRRERNRTVQRIHKVTKLVVNYAENHRLSIKMERLAGIRKLYRRGNRQAKSHRGKMNTWVYHLTQRQIAYKAQWDGISYYMVNPRGTSSYCPDCGSRVAPLADRKLYCRMCDKTWDRDVLASRNIMACAVPQTRPFRGSGEGERGGDGSNPSSRWREVGIDGTPPKS